MSFSKDPSVNIVVALLVIFVWLPLMVLLSAWGGTCLWEWFVMPIFGLGAIGMAQAYGLVMAGTWFTGTYSVILKMVHDSTREEGALGKLFTTPFSILIILGVGKVVTWFM